MLNLSAVAARLRARGISARTAGGTRLLVFMGGAWRIVEGLHLWLDEEVVVVAVAAWFEEMWAGEPVYLQMQVVEA